MKNRLANYLERLFFNRELSRWTQNARHAHSLKSDDLRTINRRGRQLRAEINRVAAIAEDRLGHPRIGAKLSRLSLHSDWAWRPEIWSVAVSPAGKSAIRNKTEIGSEITVFHDCKRRELSARQVRNRRKSYLAPYGLRLEAFHFEGSFLSLVIDLPRTAVEGLSQEHLLRLDTVVRQEAPCEIFARLNIKHGPNTETIVRELPLHEDDVMVEFDISYAAINEKRVERMWLDLIFDTPAMNRIELRDLTFSRHPRAQV